MTREEIIKEWKSVLSRDPLDAPWDLIDETLALLKEQDNCENCAMAVEDRQLVVRCEDCKYCFVDGDNVRFNMCLLNHNKVQPDDWFCADGVRKDEQ